MSDKLVIIDGNSIFYRSFYALPLLSNSKGEYSNAVYGFAIQILHIIENIKPKYMVVAFDVSKKTFRHEMYVGYKATRKPMPDELHSQIEPLKKMLKLMNVAISEKEGLEGDDIIGIISRKFTDVETIIVTGDRDSFQLVNKNVSVYFTKKGTSDLKVMTVKELEKEYGVSPKQFIDVKALQGDSSDNIPGVAGVGPKTATELIQKYGSLENIYNSINEISGKVKEKLEQGKELAFLSKQLATIVTDDRLNLSLEDCTFDFPFSLEVQDFFKHYEFKTLLKNASYFVNDDISQNHINSNKEYKIENYAKKEELQNVIEKIKKIEKFAIFIDKDVIHLSFDENEIEINVSNDLFNSGIKDYEFIELFKDIFENKNITKVCLDSKQVMYYLKDFGCTLENYFDISIAKYLIDGVPVSGIRDVFYEDNVSCIAAKLLELESEYKKKIEDENLNYLFYEVELPLAKVLFSMENVGFKIDRKVLSSLKEKYETELKNIEQKIYELAGESFNINSPKQLATILYDKIGLKHNKKKSTSADNLEELLGQNEIIEYVLRYRKVAKFLSTYINGLEPHIDNSDTVHTYFKQTLTTTGRLSSTEPNLQNIPVRSEESKEIRSMFVASDENHVLIDADYSQIELRLLAHFTEDKVFVDAFNDGVDIHTKTAGEVFGVDDSLVSKEMRRTAKVVNFGIIYGISEYGLAEDLKVPPRVAREYINNFFMKHQAVENFMNEMVRVAKETGKATTLFGRTRRLYDINATNYMVRSRAERASQNMPLQGTAADIIKIAMIKTYNALKRENLNAKLIMQVHDELIINCPKDEEKKVKEILKFEMENACKLQVPLVVDLASSFRWSDGH